MLEHDSSILADNPLGDPGRRQVPVYLPAAYDQPRYRKKRFITLYDLAAFTGSGPAHLNWRAFEENLVQKLDRLIGQKLMPPVVVVFPDCYTSFGGNQYINSSAVGQYADYLCDEIVPFVDQEIRTLASASHRGCFGKSSGGYGAIRLAMSHPDCWGGFASHAGDAYFDFVYGAEWPGALTHLQKWREPLLKPGKRSVERTPGEGLDDGRVARFLDHIRGRHQNGTQQLSSQDITTLMLLAMSATYDPDPQAPNGFRLPYDLENGLLIKERWRAWRRHDPVTMIPRYWNRLRRTRAIFIDCGWQDQYHIHFGTRQLSTALAKKGIKHRYEEFSGSHSGIDHRLDVSLPFLARHLK